VNKTLKRIHCSMHASILGATDPTVKHHQHPSFPRQFKDVHYGILKIDEFSDRPSIDPSLTPQADERASPARWRLPGRDIPRTVIVPGRKRWSSDHPARHATPRRNAHSVFNPMICN
jgi:hypothetical protein